MGPQMVGEEIVIGSVIGKLIRGTNFPWNFDPRSIVHGKLVHCRTKTLSIGPIFQGTKIFMTGPRVKKV